MILINNFFFLYPLSVYSIIGMLEPLTLLSYFHLVQAYFIQTINDSQAPLRFYLWLLNDWKKLYDLDFLEI